MPSSPSVTGVACLVLCALSFSPIAIAQTAEDAPDGGTSVAEVAPPANPPSTPPRESLPPPVPAIERRQPATAAAPQTEDAIPPEVVAPPASKPGHSATMDQVAESSEHEMHFGRTKARYSLNFFGDFSFALYSPKEGGHEPTFTLGDQDFLIRGQLGNHLIATTEFSVGFGGESEASVDLERLHVRWQDVHFFVEAGRMHTDIGYWNDAYHHGHWLQPTIDRPRWVRFEDEGGLLPVHWVGLSAEARIDAGPGDLRVVASVGNGRGKIVDDIRNGMDYSANKALHALVEYVGLGAPELRIGVSGIYDRIPGQSATYRPALPDQPIQEYILGAHVAYPAYPLIVVAEGYLVTHTASGRTYRTYGGFGLAGYSIGIVTPYFELSKIAGSGGSDPFFMPDPMLATGSYDVLDLIPGVRVDISPWAAVKLEYQYTRAPHQHDEPIHTGTANVSWGF
jgi:hypothetical protein